MTLWLVGMMGSGKTSAGQLAANSLGVPFLDIDDEIEAEHGASIPELWDEIGEDAFREFEAAAIHRVAGTNAIVSTGGGAVVDSSNRRRMKATGMVVWLRADPEVLAARLEKGSGRPLLDGHSDRGIRVSVLLEERAKAYEDAADHQIDTSGLPLEEVALRIEGLWRR